MRVTVVGAGAVGGYYGAMLARAGHAVTLIARGAHLDRLRSDGITIRGPEHTFTARVTASAEPSGPADLVLFAVKTYDTATALPSVRRASGPGTTVLTLQNGVDSADEVAVALGRETVVAGAAYIATALAAPGLIEQTGTHHRIAFGEVFDPPAELTPRVVAIADAFRAAGVEVEAAPDGRVPLWEKFIYLAPFAGLTGACRLPIGPIRARGDVRDLFTRACGEVAALARAEGVAVAGDVLQRIDEYVAKLPDSTRSSLLIDLQQGKRIEVEALQGSVVRRARRHGLDVPVMETLYAALFAHADGSV
jgi:2-dehydropantoate 2-reductase